MRYLLTVLLLYGVYVNEAHAYDAASEADAWTACQNWLVSSRGQDFPGAYCMYKQTGTNTYSILATQDGNAGLYGWTFPTGTQCPDGRDENGCISPMPTAAECAEQGMALDPEARACVDTLQCEWGAIGNGSGQYICITQVEPDPNAPNSSEDGTDCDPSKKDYKGVYQGKYYCDTNLPEAPTCAEGTAHIVEQGDTYGFACATSPESPQDAGDTKTETTTTTETETEIIETTTNPDTGKTTTTTTDKATGNTTTTINYPGTDSQTGGPCTENSLLCYPDENTGICEDASSLCENVESIKDMLDTGDAPTAKDAGSFVTDNKDALVEQAEIEFTTVIDSIKAEAGTYFDFTPVQGSLTCPFSANVLGENLEFCPDRYKAELAVVGQVVLLICAFLSVVIVMGARK